jgi:hypothetical protein
MAHTQRRIPKRYRPAIRRAAMLLVDDILHCLVDGPEVHSLALEELPPNFRLKIERDLYRWSVAFTVAATKLTLPRPLPPA